ncbi:hypothetical protein [Taibaiella koreensis]|uniref:hypothetical protein n=1 Tax=Taibaiella koreensis TaxID=1268548 RepID=UPI000E59AB55|nr:hypothetical protein [Taibaiella koreensis]
MYTGIFRKWKLICALSLITANSYGQKLGGTAPDATKVAGSGAGNAAPMGGLYSPSLYDGSLNINIPIYSYSTDDGEFGVSLGYNTRGVKADELASELGLHWQLNAGFTISRVVKDLPDELNMPADNTATLDDNATFNSYTWLKGKYAVYSQSAASAADTNVYKDGENDDFVVSLPGGSFTFNLGPGGTVFTRPQRNIKVRPLLNGIPLPDIGDQQLVDGYGSRVLEFLISDEAGNEYYFQRGDFEDRDVFDQYDDGTGIATYALTTRWVIRDIKLASGAKITYQYSNDEGGVTAELYTAYSAREGAYSTAPGSSPVRRNNAYTSRIQQILYPNGVIVYFNYDSRKRIDYLSGALREISVGTGYSGIRYRMDQAFFNKEAASPEKPYEDNVSVNYSSPDPNLRLKLKGIRLVSKDEAAEEPFYSFDYAPLPVPPRGTPGQDYFGYFNGRIPTPWQSVSPQDFKVSIPYHNEWIPNNPNNVVHPYGVDKSENIAAMKAGMLTGIRNAYGGSVAFRYGGHVMAANSISGLPTDDLFLGVNANDGLRIDTIIEQEPFHPENSRVTAFSYTGGQRFLTGGYFHYPLYLNYNTYAVKDILFTNQYISPHQLLGGANHGYSQVDVYNRTGSGQLLSHMQTLFTNFKDANGQPRLIASSGKKYYEQPYTDKQYIRDWEMGLPLQVNRYDQNDGLTSQTLNEYEPRFVPADATYTSTKVNKISLGRLQPSSMGMGEMGPHRGFYRYTDTYTPCSGKMLLTRTVTRQYTGIGVYASDTSLFRYDDHDNLSATITTDSKGDRYYSLQWYNYNFSGATSGAINQMNQNGLEKVVSLQRWRSNPLSVNPPQQGDLIESFITGYTFYNGGLFARSLYTTRLEAPMSAAAFNATGTAARILAADAGTVPAGFFETSKVVARDDKGNPLETEVSEGMDRKVMLWDVTGRKLAEATGCGYNDIGYAGFESNNSNFSYNPAGVATVTDPVGGRNAYWLSSGLISRSGLSAGKWYRVSFWATNSANIPSCTIDNNPVDLTAGPVRGNWTYYEGVFPAGSSSEEFKLFGAVNFYIDELRLSPVSVPLQTYNGDALLGTTSATDARGRMVYYEYDPMNRPNLVRDQEGHILSKTQYTVHGAE